MAARSSAWFEDKDPRDLGRWAVAAAIVLAIHGTLIATYFAWYVPMQPVGADAPIISIDIVAPDVDQVEEPKVEKPPPPQQTEPDAIVSEEKPPPPPQVEPTPPAPQTTVKTVAAAPRIDPSWQSLLLRHLQKFKNYPAEARRKSEQGIVTLTFVVDRDGHVLSRKILKSSGYSDLDAEVLSLVDRAQPLPTFPPSMTQTQMSLTVPIRFSLR